MTILASIMSALTSLSQLAKLLETLISEVKNLSQALEEKQIDKFKKEVESALKKIEDSKNDKDRKLALVELSKQLSK